MSLISLLLNLLWIVCGGLWRALGWVIAAVVMAITIIGLPWARAAFSIAAYTLLPFGYKAVPRGEYFGREDVGTGPLGIVGNIVWLLLAGWWLALGHLVTAILRRDHRGHPVRLGAPEACRSGAMADRESDRAGAERAVPVGARLALTMFSWRLPAGSVYLARPIRFLRREQGRVLGVRMSIGTEDAMKQSVTKSKNSPTALTHK